MNAVRRIFLVIYSVVFLAALGGLGALAWNQDQQLDLNISDLKINGFIEASDGAKWALTGVLAGLGVLGLLTLLMAVWPARSGGSKGTLRIRQSDGGYVEVTASAVESLVREAVEALPEVRRASPRIRLSGGAIDTYLDVDIEPSTSIANATKLLAQTVEDVLRDHVGVSSVRRPVIRITYDELAARPVPTSKRRPEPAFEPAVYPNDVPPRATEPEDRPREMDPQTQMKPPVEVTDAARPPEAPNFVSSSEEETPAQ